MKRIPATVVTGFLGAGKTTLIRHLLENAQGARMALIVNEFGDVGVDGELLQACGDEACGAGGIVELANGCICCTVADEFLPAMTALIERPQRPDHILIETSGLALPQPLIKAFNWPQVKAAVTVDGVIAVVDAPAVREGLFAADPARVEALRRADVSLDHESPLHELFEDQLMAADMVVLNKADLIPPREVEALKASLAAQARPGVRIVPAEHGRLDPAILLGLGAAAEDDHRPTHHELEGAADHDHDDFVSFAIDLPPAPSREALLAAMADVMRHHPVLRIKGFAAITGSPARFVAQATGPRVDGWFDRPWGKDTPTTRLVLIGLKGLEAEKAKETLYKILGC